MPYTKQVRYEGEFEGRKVVVIMRPLSFVDALEADATEIVPKSDSLEDKKIALQQTMLALAKILLPKLSGYIESMEGLIDADGQSISKEEFCTAAYFTVPAVEAVLQLVQAANPGNFRAPPAASVS